jgi:hypothetical protein
MRQSRLKFWQDLGFDTAKFTIQLLLVGVVGGVLVQEYNRGRARKEAANEFRKLVMRSLIRAYSDIKEARRILRAKCVSPRGGTRGEEGLELPGGAYDEAMKQINGTQIDLEILLRELKVFRDAFCQAGALTRHLTEMEQYLGNLVDEYETKRRDYGDSNCRALSAMPAIQAFLAKRPRGDFQKGFGRHFQAAVAILEEERLRL